MENFNFKIKKIPDSYFSIIKLQKSKICLQLWKFKFLNKKMGILNFSILNP